MIRNAPKSIIQAENDLDFFLEWTEKFLNQNTKKCFRFETKLIDLDRANDDVQTRCDSVLETQSPDSRAGSFISQQGGAETLL